MGIIKYKKLLSSCHQRRKLKSRKRNKPISVHLKPVPLLKSTTSVLFISSPLSTTLSFTSPISPVEKPTAESPVERRLRLIEKNPPLTLQCLLLKMFANFLRMLESTPSISNLEEEVDPTPRPQDQVPNPLSELLPEMDLRSVELKMLPQSQPIPPEEEVVEEVEDSELPQVSALSYRKKHNVI